MAMKVSTFNGCKVYNLSSGKALPSFLSESKKRALAKDEDYRKRLDLIQDFEMTIASQCIKMTPDGEHIIVAGGYPPLVRCYTTSDMSMKFQRGMTCEIVAMETLSDDYGKLVFLQADRTLNFHAPYGTHYSVRVPKFGRDIVYNWDNCDLCVGASGDEVYRLNLESGQFKEPFKLGYSGCNKVNINPAHQLLACGGDGGVCEFWDPRARTAAAKIFVSDPNVGKTDITALKFDIDGLTLGVGTSNGNCLMYDIRSKNPVYTKEHQYGLPLVDITFHNTSRNIISTDKKIVKIWERDEPDRGRIVTNIETPADINDVLCVSDRRGQSGLLMLAGEQSRIMTYFVPQLAPAPRWCSFLEGITEELEETAGQTVYEDFKFLTKKEVEALGATSLIGTPMLKAYMHGFFVEIKLYNKLRAVSNPMEYEEYRKKKIADKIAEKTQSRITAVKRLPKVNADLAKKFMKSGKTEAENGGVAAAAGVNIDDRFKTLFEREEFQQDTEAIEYKLRNPTTSTKQRHANHGDSEDELDDMYQAVDEPSSARGGSSKSKNGSYGNDDFEDDSDFDDDDEEEEEEEEYGNGSGRYEENEEESDNELGLYTHEKPRVFDKKSKKKSNNSRGGDDGDGDDDDDSNLGPIERLTRRLAAKAAERAQKQSGSSSYTTAADVRRNRRMSTTTTTTSSSSRDNNTGGWGRMNASSSSSSNKRMYELQPGMSSSAAMFSHTDEAKRQRLVDKKTSSIPISQRMSEESNNAGSGSAAGRRGISGVKYVKNGKEGLVREFSYMPAEGKKGGSGSTSGGATMSGGKVDREREQYAAAHHNASRGSAAGAGGGEGRGGGRSGGKGRGGRGGGRGGRR